ncbi:MAG: dCTP deaminase [Halodesulfurarchaeum sp.]
MARDLTELVTGLVHEPTQVTEDGLDLTLAQVYAVREPGDVDFGGDELEVASIEPIEPGLRDPEDDYGWWTLHAGQYLIEHNEELVSDLERPVVVQTRPALTERGTFHPTRHVTELGRVPLSVGGAGINLKENARVSTVIEE